MEREYSRLVALGNSSSQVGSLLACAAFCSFRSRSVSMPAASSQLRQSYAPGRSKGVLGTVPVECHPPSYKEAESCRLEMICLRAGPRRHGETLSPSLSLSLNFTLTLDLSFFLFPPLVVSSRPPKVTSQRFPSHSPDSPTTTFLNNVPPPRSKPTTTRLQQPTFPSTIARAMTMETPSPPTRRCS